MTKQQRKAHHGGKYALVLQQPADRGTTRQEPVSVRFLRRFTQDNSIEVQREKNVL